MTTTDPRTILAEMQVVHDAALSSNASRTLGKTLDALTAVLDLHQPLTPTRHGTECRECSNPTTWAVWPCMTVRAITAALEVEG